MSTYLERFGKGCSNPGCNQLLSHSIVCQGKLPSILRCPLRVNKEFHNVDIEDADLCELHPDVPLVLNPYLYQT